VSASSFAESFGPFPCPQYTHRGRQHEREKEKMLLVSGTVINESYAPFVGRVLLRRFCSSVGFWYEPWSDDYDRWIGRLRTERALTGPQNFPCD
jgi:hypothetical protein